MKKPKVTIIQRILPHYRVDLFSRLDSLLCARGVDLEVIYGQHREGAVPKTVDVSERWAKKINNRYFDVCGHELVWQPVRGNARKSDLVIIEQASRLMVNYRLLMDRQAGSSTLVAFWGHGTNFQARTSHALSERLKKKLATWVDWWFAYTDRSKSLVLGAGFAEARITVVQNAIDTKGLGESLQSLSTVDLERARAKLGLSGQTVGIFCGGMYREKQLDFLIEACARIRSRIPDFEMLFVGEGPDQSIVETACAEHRWMHYVGPAIGSDVVVFFALSQALLMPGLVGLVILDSFATGRPIFTTDIPIHSPEIAYLNPGINGCMTQYAVEAYVDCVCDYFIHPEKMAVLVRGCNQSARQYTLEKMAENLAEGVLKCLSEGRLSSTARMRR
jgi:glycosyltransferase involved in cell wall biosynthesis